LATVENAREFVRSIFAPERYDLSEIGRHHFNERYGLPTDAKATAQRTVSIEDLRLILKNIVEMNHDPGQLLTISTTSVSVACATLVKCSSSVCVLV
jgi:hypothetical protein